jgi:post-segregation antitoxin (ccd killing protein)
MYAAKNRARIKVKTHEWYEKNRETILAKNRAKVEAWHKENPEAILEHKRRYREKNREKLREADRKYVRTENGQLASRRRVAKAALDLEAMAGRPRPVVCDACGGPPDPKRGLHYDHCHKHGHFRGWLCRECNLALGNVRDDRARLLKLVAYLDRTKDGPVAQLTLSGV